MSYGGAARDVQVVVAGRRAARRVDRGRAVPDRVGRSPVRGALARLDGARRVSSRADLRCRAVALTTSACPRRTLRNVLDVLRWRRRAFCVLSVSVFAASWRNSPRQSPCALLAERFRASRERRPWSAQFLRRHARRFGGFAARPASWFAPRRDVAVTIASAASARCALPSAAWRTAFCGALPRVDGVVEGLAVVALIDGGVRLLQRRRRRRCIRPPRSVSAPAARARSSGGLGLVDLFLGRLGTARDQQQQGRSSGSAIRGRSDARRESIAAAADDAGCVYDEDRRAARSAA